MSAEKSEIYSLTGRVNDLEVVVVGLKEKVADLEKDRDEVDQQRECLHEWDYHHINREEGHAVFWCGNCRMEKLEAQVVELEKQQQITTTCRKETSVCVNVHREHIVSLESDRQDLTMRIEKLEGKHDRI